MSGAVVNANSVTASVGGNLNIESLQDSNTYKEQQTSSGGSITFGPGGIPTGGSLSTGKTNIDSNYNSTSQQSAIRAGDGGFQVSVAGNTTLTGGPITSTQKAIDDKANSFTTGGTITTTDLSNNAAYNANASNFRGTTSIRSLTTSMPS